MSTPPGEAETKKEAGGSPESPRQRSCGDSGAESAERVPNGDASRVMAGTAGSHGGRVRFAWYSSDHASVRVALYAGLFGSAHRQNTSKSRPASAAAAAAYVPVPLARTPSSLT